LADLYRKRGQYTTALNMYNSALMSIVKTLGRENSEASDILNNIGLVQHQLGNYTDAIKFFNEALKIVRNQFGEQHYKVGMYLNNSGLAHAINNNYVDAHFQLKQALQILIHNLGSNHVEVADCYTNLGDVCLKLYVEAGGQGNKLSEAENYYTQANKIIGDNLGKDHPKCQQFASLLFICQNYNKF